MYFVILEPLCPPPPQIDHGKFLLQGQSFGAMATYECDEGYELPRKYSERQCLLNKNWSGYSPLCRSMDGLLFLHLECPNNSGASQCHY